MSPTITLTIDPGENYGDDLRRRLEEYGITQAELARQMQVEPTQVNRWVRSGFNPQYENLVAIELAILAIRKRQARREQKSE